MSLPAVDFSLVDESTEFVHQDPLQKEIPMKPRKSVSNRIGIESLEQRVALAGNVSISFSGSGSSRDLVITGDNSGNDIEIYSTGVLDQFVIKGRNNTKINNVNNGTFRLDNFDFEDDIVIDLKGGNDVLSIRGADSGFGDFDAWNDLNISTGSGNDKIELKYVQTGGHGINGSDLLIDTGTGADTVILRNVDVQDDLRINNSTSSQSMSTKVRVDLYDTYVGDTLEIKLNYSKGVVNMTAMNAAEFDVDLFGGDDKLNIKRSRARSKFRLDGGSDNDDLNLYNNSTSFSGISFKTPTKKDTWYS